MVNLTRKVDAPVCSLRTTWGFCTPYVCVQYTLAHYMRMQSWNLYSTPLAGGKSSNLLALPNPGPTYLHPRFCGVSPDGLFFWEADFTRFNVRFQNPGAPHLRCSCTRIR